MVGTKLYSGMKLIFGERTCSQLADVITEDPEIFLSPPKEGAAKNEEEETFLDKGALVVRDGPEGSVGRRRLAEGEIGIEAESYVACRILLADLCCPVGVPKPETDLGFLLLGVGG